MPIVNWVSEKDERFTRCNHDFFVSLCVPRSQPRNVQETRLDTLVVHECSNREHLREDICKFVKRLESVKKGEGRLWESEREKEL